MQTRTMEIRIADEQTENDEMIVEGRAIVYGQKTMIYRDSSGKEYFEVIAAGSLDNADMSDVVFRFNHGKNGNPMPMARTTNGTLQLLKDGQGLSIRASLAKTTDGKDLYALIQRGDINKMSFAFVVDTDNYDTKTNTRTITRFERIADVSAVDFPAYDGTNIVARSLQESQEHEKELQKQILRKKIILRTFL